MCRSPVTMVYPYSVNCPAIGNLGYSLNQDTEAMAGVDIRFSRRGIAEWPDISLRAAESGYDLIAGGITILNSRRYDAIGTPRVAFTSGHIAFWQSLTS